MLKRILSRVFGLKRVYYRPLSLADGVMKTRRPLGK